MQNYMTDIPDKGLRAVLRSPKLDATFGEQRCFGFYYYMNVGKFGILRVYQVADDRNSKRKLLWKRSKNHKKDWNKVEISYNTTGGQWDYIEIEAERGSQKNGDIAIDDVMLSEVSCEVLHMPGKLLCDIYFTESSTSLAIFFLTRTSNRGVATPLKYPNHSYILLLISE